MSDLESQVRTLLREVADEFPPQRILPSTLVPRARRRVTIVQGARVLTAAALLLVVVTGLRWSLRQPVPADTPAPTPTVAPSGSARFESPLHGYSIDLRPEWQVTPSTIPWTWGDTPHSDVVVVNGDTYSFDVTIASVALPDDVTEAEWAQLERDSFRDIKNGTCVGQLPTDDAVELDGVTAPRFTACDGDVLVTAATGRRGYVIATAGPVQDHETVFEEVLAAIELLPRSAGAPDGSPGWRGIWPQATRQGALQAQEEADAGDPSRAWQVDANQDGLVGKRFVESELGWERALETGVSYVPQDAEQAWEAEVVEWSFIRCLPDATNTPFESDPRAGDCAPTLDATHYQQVVVQVEQPIRRGRSGIWLVVRWREIASYEQALPPPEPEARDLVERFLEARVSGGGAEAFLRGDPPFAAPPLYGDGGSSFERYEIASVGQPAWPIGNRCVRVRLFAQNGSIVRETLSIGPDEVRDGVVSWCPYGYAGM